MSPIYEKLDPFHLLDVKNPLHPSIFIDTPEYNMLILALPAYVENEIVINPCSFVFNDTEYYYYDISDDRFVSCGSMEQIYEIINAKTTLVMDMMEEFHDAIDCVEDMLYNNKAFKTFNSYWLTNKKKLSKISRLLIVAIDAVEDFLEVCVKDDSPLAVHFKDIYEHLERTDRSATYALEQLANLYSFYDSRNSERMNSIMYFLTILSGVFLPLSLIVGYLGMNTHGLPLVDNEYGTWIATGMLLSCASGMGFLIRYLSNKH